MIEKKYTNDYRLENIPAKNGKLKTVPVYIGKYYAFSASKEKLKVYRRFFTIMIICAWASFIAGFAFYRNGGVTGQYYTSLPLAFCVFPLIYLSLAVFYFLTAKEKSTREIKEKIYDRAAKNSLVLAILSGIALLGCMISFLLKFAGIIKKVVIYNDIIFTLLTIMLFIFAYLMFIRKNAIIMKIID